jgi:hypothetical protein
MKNIIALESTITSNLLMIRPKYFGFNEETASNNAFQTNDKDLNSSQIAALALDEFDHFVEVLKREGLSITVIEDRNNPVISDAVFPNNWFSTHADGSVVTYPMFSKQRRLERREDIFDLLAKKFIISGRFHFEEAEVNNQFLEGTGSLILDRSNKMVYACRSIRTNELLLQQWADKMKYKRCVFSARDKNNLDIYHTNVMMAIGEDFVIWGGDSLPDKSEREIVENKFKETGKTIIPISNEQIGFFAGNMLAVKNVSGERLLLMSNSAYNSLTNEQITQIKSFSRIIKGNIPTIEKYGGGSVRCMLAEIYLPEKA